LRGQCRCHIHITLHAVALGAYVNVIRGGMCGPLAMCADAASRVHAARAAAKVAGALRRSVGTTRRLPRAAVGLGRRPRGFAAVSRRCPIKLLHTGLTNGVVVSHRRIAGARGQPRGPGGPHDSIHERKNDFGVARFACMFCCTVQIWMQVAAQENSRDHDRPRDMSTVARRGARAFTARAGRAVGMRRAGRATFLKLSGVICAAGPSAPRKHAF
jgi:hypothetical protein